tara:strand:+ start:604 stop:1050 length:447 start_codon:yes stop_codon:yes gene_type:complete
MQSSNYTDVEQQEPRSQNKERQDDEEDFKKMAHYHEMAQVHRLTRKIYFQCLVLMVVIGVLLFVFASRSPFKNVAPDVNNIMTIVCIALFLILSFFAFMCGSENAQTKLFLIILISIFLGLSTGFFVAMNVSITSKHSNTYKYYNDPT